MSNIFDRGNYPTQEPDTLVVGDRWVWRRDDLVSDYPLDEYALEYRFTEDSTGNTNAFTIAATEAESTYLVEIASAVTASLTAGDYQWAAFIIRSSDSQRVVVDQGRTEILPNLQNRFGSGSFFECIYSCSSVFESFLDKLSVSLGIKISCIVSLTVS